MSNQTQNNPGMNCTNENTCSLEKSQVNRNSNNHHVEFAEEFNPNGQFKCKTNPAPLARREFEPNDQHPVSERTAWH